MSEIVHLGEGGSVRCTGESTYRIAGDPRGFWWRVDDYPLTSLSLRDVTCPACRRLGHRKNPWARYAGPVTQEEVDDIRRSSPEDADSLQRLVDAPRCRSCGRYEPEVEGVEGSWTIADGLCDRCARYH
jgi:hypothetical protein